jgi:D-amino-acid oxidase
MGWGYTAPVFDMPRYLGHLHSRLADLGVCTEILDAPLRSLDEATGFAPVIVNCTGLGARGLVPDSRLTPSWGQLVVVDNPGVTGFFSDYPEAVEPTYYIAHPDHVILGGCIYPTAAKADEARTAAERIVRRCALVEPRLSGARILNIRTGFRPVRPEVRLEKTVLDGTTIVHNYGHGGSGVTLSWGCARQVQAMLG